MSELKFRAWDKARNEFLSAGRILISIEPGKLPVCSHMFLDILTDPDVYQDRFIIERYTGLKDKNGKEIYEGDVFRTSMGVVAVVEWEKEGRFLGFTVSGERKIVYINREPAVEVIGNIYENPELLNTNPEKHGLTQQEYNDMRHAITGD